MNSEGLDLRLPKEDFQYIGKWLTSERANVLQKALATELNWQQGDVFIFGKWQKIPRLQAFHGDYGLGYTYSGKTLFPEPWTPSLLQIKAELNQLGFFPNVVLANLYRDGEDKMGWHRDNEPELGDQPQILSLSLGAARDFQLRHRETRTRVDLRLDHGSLLVMQGNSQQEWEHQLPPRKRCKEPRLNLTFRTIIPASL
ncbi:MAG: alpha-ketoglutarate-dependent dioxygenase AlkB [Idiomarina sp.]|nr:alpha-ketoglutarate-dependent dioxygenase AlkB [Idiomarina sp.]